MKRYVKNLSVVAGVLLLGVIVVGRAHSNPPDESNARQSQSGEIPNTQIDPQAFLDSTQKAIKLRSNRRLTEDEFIRQSREKGVIVLDARSKNRYDQLHVDGAISLPFTDITFDSLSQRLPDKSVKILIYCNNNFRGNVPEFQSKSRGAALNLSTFVSLYEYGYRNVYELGPELDLDKTKLKLVGTEAAKYVARSN
jgi:Rhodanese-like domain